MKPLALLPFILAATSCFPTVPYDQQLPPYRDGEPYYPYRRSSARETGRYEPLAERQAPPPRDFEPRQPEARVEEEPAEEPAPPRRTGRQDYPVAERTEKPGMVLSPYAPYNVIDVEGFKSGDLAKDPSNGKIFRVP